MNRNAAIVLHQSREGHILEAIQIPIVYNQYGDYDPDGLMYVLEEDSERIQEEAVRRFHQTPPQPMEEVQPLVLRVNLGDTVKRYISETALAEDCPSMFRECDMMWTHQMVPVSGSIRTVRRITK